MQITLNVLLVEDSPDDAELITRALGRAGYDAAWQRVDTAAALADALREQPWDVVLCDYVMPRFSGPEALHQVQACNPDLPVVLVSGEVSQAAAVEAMRAGARDYVMKSDLARLAPVVERELAEARRRRAAQQARAESEVRLRELVDDLDGVVWEADPISLRFLFVSGRAASLLGYPLERWRDEPAFWADRLHADDRERVLLAIRDAVTSRRDLQVEYRLVAADGRAVWVRQTGRAVVDPAGQVVRLRGLLVDISARRLADRAMRRRLEGERLVAGVLMQLAAVDAGQLDACVRDSLRRVAELVGATRGYVVLLDAGGRSARISHEWRAPGHGLPPSDAAALPVSTAPWWWATLRAHRPIVARRRDDLPPEAAAERAALAARGVGAIVAVPLVEGGGLRGYVCLGADGELNAAADDLVAMLRLVGDRILGALDRARAERELRESERRFRELVENLSEVTCTIDLFGHLTYVSPNIEAYAGVRPEQVIGRSFRDFIGNADHVEPGLFARLLAGEPLVTELRIQLAGGAYRWVRTSSRPLLRDGIVTGVQVVLEDVTEHKQVEEQRELLELLTTQAPVGIVVTDAAGQVTAANPMALEILGSPSEEATTRLNVLSVPALRAAGVDALFRGALERQERGTLEARYRSHWGREAITLLHVAPLFDASRRVRGSVAVLEDVSLRHEAEQALRDREQRLRSLIDGLGPSVLVGLATPDGRLVEASRSALDLTGLRIEDIRGLAVADLPPFRHAEAGQRQLREAVERAVAGLATRFDVGLHLGPNDRRILDFHVQPLRGTDGEVLYIIGTGVDVTERVDAQADLARLNDELERRVVERTTELAAVNRELEAFTSSVSHDLRAPLRAVLGFSRGLLDEAAAGLADRARQDVERINAAATRMQQLIDALLELARIGHGQLRRAPVDLGQLARAQAAELQRAEPQRRVAFAVADDLVADGDPRLLQIVIANLVGNAWKYTAPRATAHIAVGAEMIDGERTYVVRDDGVGFAAHEAATLFVPFRRLHGAEFAGSGVGLATVARIIQRHGGRIWATAEPDRGAAFYFTLGATPAP